MNALAELLEADDRIAAAVLFGSVERGTAREGSDVDVAYLPAGPLARERIDDDLIDLLGTLGLASGRDVHLVDLQRAELPLRRTILDGGRVLFDRSHGALRRLHRATAIEYVDHEFLRRIVDAAQLRKLGASGG